MRQHRSTRSTDKRKPGPWASACPGRRSGSSTPGNPVADGEAGEVLIQGPNVMRGYLNRPEETAKTLVDGWLHTGDVGRLDEDGYLVLVDRAKDMIIRGGENIYPKEIEAVVYQLPQIAEAAVVGRAQSALRRRAGVVRVAELRRHRSTPTASATHLAESLSKYKLPVEITILDEPSQEPGRQDRQARAAETTRRNHGDMQTAQQIKETTQMGFIKPNLPRRRSGHLHAKPLMERMTDPGHRLGGQRIRRRRGWCTPSTSLKLIFFYALGGIVVATLTSGLLAFWHVSQWWNQPIVYQKAVLWTVLLETDRRRGILGPAGRQDQADDRRHPVLGAARHHPAAAVEVGAVH